MPRGSHLKVWLLAAALGCDGQVTARAGAVETTVTTVRSAHPTTRATTTTATTPSALRGAGNQTEADHEGRVVSDAAEAALGSSAKGKAKSPPTPCRKASVEVCVRGCSPAGFAECAAHCTEQCDELVWGKDWRDETATSATAITATPSEGWPIPPNVLAGCAVLVLAAWAWLAYHTSDFQEGYICIQEQDPAKRALFIGGICYWVAMPSAMITASFWSTCEEGVPTWAYGIYAVFLAAHLGSIYYAAQHQDLAELWPSSLWTVMSSLPVLMAFTMLEHLDMGTDMLFPGSAAACRSDITGAWLATWREARFGSFMVPLLEKLTFGGTMLALFVAGAYLPQFLGVFSFFCPFLFVAVLFLVSIWGAVGWWAGLPCVALCVLACVVFLDHMQWDTFRDVFMKKYTGIAMWTGIVVFPDKSEDEDKKVGKSVVLGLSKLLFETVLQLWLQATFFELSFHLTSGEAKIKTLVSMSLGLAMALRKLLPVAASTFKIVKDMLSGDSSPDTVAYVFISIIAVLLILCLVFVAWTAAKVVFAYRCPSALWNLTSGCVPVGSAF